MEVTMHSMALIFVTLLALLVAPAGADERPPTTAAEVRALYERLRPGMSIAEVAGLAARPRLGTGAEPVTGWLLWSAPQPGAATAVLRASFRDGQLARLEYEAFGEEYQRLAKGPDLAVEMSEIELRRLWRRTQAVESCQEALDAFHRLLLHAQERLTPSEQAAWVRALELRRAAEAER
jgi:hypothetical protein